MMLVAGHEMEQSKQEEQHSIVSKFIALRVQQWLDSFLTNPIILFLSFSNMSFKLNLKLATVHGREAAWRTSHNWMDEVPTLIIGISMAASKSRIGTKKCLCSSKQ